MHTLEAPGLQFCLDAEQINELCDAAERIFKEEPSVLRLRGEPPPSLDTSLSNSGELVQSCLTQTVVHRTCVTTTDFLIPHRPAAPIKLFGDLHGQFGDLMRLFEEYGTPSTAGDITYIDYLFLARF